MAAVIVSAAVGAAVIVCAAVIVSAAVIVTAAVIVSAAVVTEPEGCSPARVDAKQSWASPVRSGGRLDVPDRVV
jgi:hypothetical protein